MRLKKPLRYRQLGWIGVLWMLITFCFEGLLLAQPPKGNIQIVGAMRNVMWKGQLMGTIDLDTLQNKDHLYGLGPVEKLQGEILILDGKCYQSSVVDQNNMAVKETYKVKAPFFGYSHISKWKEENLPDSVVSLPQLEGCLQKRLLKQTEPIFFRLAGIVEMAKIHVVNLPKGSHVKNPDDAHKGQQNYPVSQSEVEILGFYSTQHQSVFTHHDTFMHLHLLTVDKKKMGHLDSANFSPRAMKLYLPF